MSDPRAAARAIDALRRGWPITIDGLSLLNIETADEARLASFDPAATADILISSGRAATLTLANQLGAADPDRPVLIERAPWIDFACATALSDPALDLSYPMKGPFRTIALEREENSAAALQLARIAGLLPAFFQGGADTDVKVSVTDLDAFQDPMRLAIATRARLPVRGGEHGEIVAFRSPEGGDEHVALIFGSPNGSTPLVRLHSECLTGDALGSLKCDCGPQLDQAIEKIALSGWGMLLYLRQEGRGIGLINKLRAYRLQDQGFDTVDANIRLGFAVDPRDFRLAAQMLTLLGQDRIRLLTNNPAKVERLECAGITVVERVPHWMPPQRHNSAYLATKRDRSGHQL